MEATNLIFIYPPFYSVEDIFAGSDIAAAHGLPLVAIRISNTGQLSRKERDDLKAYGQERGLRVYDDIKRLEHRLAEEQIAKVRERSKAGRDRSADPRGLGRRAKGQRPEETVYQACGNLRLFAGQKYNDRHGLFDQGRLPLPLGCRLTDVRVG